VALVADLTKPALPAHMGEPAEDTQAGVGTLVDHVAPPGHFTEPTTARPVAWIADLKVIETTAGKPARTVVEERALDADAGRAERAVEPNRPGPPGPGAHERVLRNPGRCDRLAARRSATAPRLLVPLHGDDDRRGRRGPKRPDPLASSGPRSVAGARLLLEGRAVVLPRPAPDATVALSGSIGVDRSASRAWGGRPNP
jgi:hypothetical protein